MAKLTQPELFRIATIKAALKLECLGMKHSRGSVVPAAKQMLVSIGRTPDKKKQDLFNQYVELVAELSKPKAQ